MRSLLGIIVAVALHLGFILFGGLILMNVKKDEHKMVEVDIVSTEDEKKPEPKPEEPKEKPPELQEEKPPDVVKTMEVIDQELSREELTSAPALDAINLSQLDAMLSGTGGAGDFSQSFGLSSGGRIGGTGKAGLQEETLQEAFNLAEIDQKPRAIFQAAPIYPAQMRAQKLEGVVTVIFIVDPIGKVTNQRVERSSHVAFDKPALEAIKQWKFEPGTKGGQRVACKMRVSIRFERS